MGDSDLYQDVHKPAAFHKCSSGLLVLLTSSGDSSLTYDTEWFKITCLSISGHWDKQALCLLRVVGMLPLVGMSGWKGKRTMVTEHELLSFNSGFIYLVVWLSQGFG